MGWRCNRPSTIPKADGPLAGPRAVQAGLQAVDLPLLGLGDLDLQQQGQAGFAVPPLASCGLQNAQSNETEKVMSKSYANPSLATRAV